MPGVIPCWTTGLMNHYVLIVLYLYNTELSLHSPLHYIGLFNKVTSHYQRKQEKLFPHPQISSCSAVRHPSLPRLKFIQSSSSKKKKKFFFNKKNLPWRSLTHLVKFLYGCPRTPAKKIWVYSYDVTRRMYIFII